MCRPNKVKCFVCGEWFSKSERDVRCEECGDWKCVHCDSCICNLTEREKRIVLAMIQTYEKFITELTHIEYDFKPHAKILQGVKVIDNHPRV